MAMLMIHKYLPPSLIPPDLEDVTMKRLCDLVAKARVCREMHREDVQVGIAKAFPKEE